MTVKNNEFFKIALSTALGVALAVCTPLCFCVAHAVAQTSDGAADELESKDKNSVRYSSDGETFVVSDGVETIEEWAFSARSRRNAFSERRESKIVFPNSLKKIGSNAFRGWLELSSIEFPESLEELGSGVFSNCSRLTTVVIPKNVVKIGLGPFSGCSLLTSVDVAEDNPVFCSVDGVVFSKDLKTLVLCPCGKEGEYVVPDGVTTIRTSAFSSCSKLTSIVVPPSVETIGDQAFLDCASLSKVVLPNDVKSLGRQVFRACANLSSVFIPESVQSIGEKAFDDCVSLREIEVSPGNAVYRSIDGVLFADRGKTLVKCPEKIGKTRYVVPDGVEKIDVAAFRRCGTLTSLVISNGVKTIEPEAFHYCAALTSIVISESVEAIDRYAFSYCPALQSIDVAENNANYRSADGILYAKAAKTLVRCPEGTKIEKYSVPEGVEEIGDSAFARCAVLKSVVLPQGVREIGSGAFYGCSALTSIVIPESDVRMGVDLFATLSNKPPTIYAPRGSAAYRYAGDKGLPFEPIDRLTVGKKGDVHLILIVVTKPELEDVGRKWREKIESAFYGTPGKTDSRPLLSSLKVNAPAEKWIEPGKEDVASFTYVTGEEATPWNIPKICEKVSDEAKPEDAIVAILLAPVRDPKAPREYVDRMTIAPAIRSENHRLTIVLTDVYESTVDGFKGLRPTVETQTYIPEFLPKKGSYLKRFLEEAEGAFQINSADFEHGAFIEAGNESGSFESTRFADAFARFAANGYYLERELTPDGFYKLLRMELARDTLNYVACSRIKFYEQTPMFFLTTNYVPQIVNSELKDPETLTDLWRADAERYTVLKKSCEFPENKEKKTMVLTTETFVPAAK